MGLSTYFTHGLMLFHAAHTTAKPVLEHTKTYPAFDSFSSTSVPTAATASNPTPPENASSSKLEVRNSNAQIGESMRTSMVHDHAYLAATNGIIITTGAFEAGDWCQSQDWCVPAMEQAAKTIADSVTYSTNIGNPDYDDACILKSAVTASQKAGMEGIMWSYKLFQGRDGLKSSDPADCEQPMHGLHSLMWQLYTSDEGSRINATAVNQAMAKMSDDEDEDDTLAPTDNTQTQNEAENSALSKRGDNGGNDGGNNDGNDDDKKKSGTDKAAEIAVPLLAVAGIIGVSNWQSRQPWFRTKYGPYGTEAEKAAAKRI